MKNEILELEANDISLLPWLDNLTGGTLVFVTDRNFLNPVSIEATKEVTEHSIYLVGTSQVFSRKTGLSENGVNRLMPTTEWTISCVRHIQKRKQLVQDMALVDWPQVSVETIEQIKNLLDKP